MCSLRFTCRLIGSDAHRMPLPTPPPGAASHLAPVTRSQAGDVVIIHSRALLPKGSPYCTRTAADTLPSVSLPVRALALHRVLVCAARKGCSDPVFAYQPSGLADPAPRTPLLCPRRPALTWQRRPPATGHFSVSACELRHHRSWPLGALQSLQSLETGSFPQNLLSS